MARHRLLLFTLSLSLSPACTTSLPNPAGDAPDPLDAGAEEPDAPVTRRADAAPDLCEAPSPMSLGAPAGGGVSGETFVQVNWEVADERRAMLQLRAVDGAITPRVYDHGASFLELVGPGDIFDVEVRLWVKHPLDDTAFEEFIARTGQVKVTDVELAEPASISFETSALELVRVRRSADYDFDLHPEACTRTVVDVPLVIDLPLVQAQG